MSKDTCTREFYSDSSRYADIINGLLCNGQQVVSGSDLQVVDGRTGKKTRDLLYQVSFGMNFAIIGIENQEYIDYSLSHRMMLYEAGEYERQRAIIRKDIKEHHEGVTKDEFQCRFRKDDHLYPQVNLCLYYGKEPWDGKRDLCGITDFSDIPDSIRDKVQDYHTHVVEVRRLEDTSVFQTDVRQVFDFIRFAEEPEKLKELLRTDSEFQNMNKDAFEFISYYVKAEYLQECKQFQEKGEKINMCRALQIIFEEERAAGRSLGLAEGRAEGLAEGRAEGREQERRLLIRNALSLNLSIEQITNLFKCSEEYVEQVRQSTELAI